MSCVKYSNSNFRAPDLDILLPSPVFTKMPKFKISQYLGYNIARTSSSFIYLGWKALSNGEGRKTEKNLQVIEKEMGKEEDEGDICQSGEEETRKQGSTK